MERNEAMFRMARHVDFERCRTWLRGLLALVFLMGNEIHRHSGEMIPA